MEPLIIYLLKSALVITTVFLFYQIIRNDLNFVRNRIFLVAGLAAAFVLPLLAFVPTGSTGITYFVQLPPVVIGTEAFSVTPSGTLSPLKMLFIIYTAGAFTVLVMRLFSLFRLMRLVKGSEGVRGLGYRIVITEGNTAPFSFFGTIFLPRHLNDMEAETIKAHEQAHIRGRHSLDVLFMELVVVLQWFNPFAWLYRKALREVHEFHADSVVLRSGTDKAGYMQLLLARALNSSTADITNNFCQIKIKRRLKMITKNANARKSGLKFLLMVPFMCTFLWLLASGSIVSGNNSFALAKASGPETSQLLPVDALLPVNDTEEDTGLVFQVVEVMPEYPGGEEARAKFIVENVQYPAEAKEKGIQGTVYVSFVIDTDGAVTDVKILRGVGGGCDEEALRVVKLMPRWIPGKQRGKNVKVQFNMPVKFKLS